MRVSLQTFTVGGHGHLDLRFNMEMGCVATGDTNTLPAVYLEFSNIGEPLLIRSGGREVSIDGVLWHRAYFGDADAGFNAVLVQLLSGQLPTLNATGLNVGKGRGRDRPTYHAARTDVEMSFKRFSHSGGRRSLAYNPKLKSQCAALELKL